MGAIFKRHVAHNRVTENRELSGGLSGKHLDIGRIVFGHYIAAGHAVAAVVAGRALIAGLGERGLAYVSHPDTEFGGAALDDAIGAAHRHRWKKLAIG